MTTRYYEEAGRIIMSKPGHNAAPSTPDSFKIFDSNWSIGNVLIASGDIAIGNGSHTINFPAQHFIPAVEVEAYDSSNHAGVSIVTKDRKSTRLNSSH